MLGMNGGDITAGETEYVLGEGFNLLTRLLLSVDGPEPRNFRERGQQVLSAIRAAWTILRQNCERDTYLNLTEDVERFALTKSLIEFLSACSVWSVQEMRTYLVRGICIDGIQVGGTRVVHFHPRQESRTELVVGSCSLMFVTTMTSRIKTYAFFFQYY